MYYTADEFRAMVRRSPKRFYVYTILAQGVPIYVGKGLQTCGTIRALAHAKAARHGDTSPKSKALRSLWRQGKHEQYVLEIACNSEETAFFVEQATIGQYKRRCDGGTLFNRATGGQGSSGYRASKATRTKMSESRTGKPLSANHCKAIGDGRRLSLKVRLDNERRKIPVQVHGVTYSCRQDAADALGLCRGTLSYRLGKWPGYKELR